MPVPVPRSQMVWIVSLLGSCGLSGARPVPAVRPALLQAAGGAGAGGETGARPAGGRLALAHENDIFVGDDSNFTAAASIAWISDELSGYGPDSLPRRIGDALSFLPKAGAPDYDRFLLLDLGMEMYTPRDIEAPAPPPGEQPYAGVLALDTSILTRGEASQHQYTLRLGLVGPSSGAGGLQRWIHRTIGARVPRGWDTQLRDEFLVNVLYQYNRRLLRGSTGGWHYDLAANAGGGAGNYYTGGNVGLNLRLGGELPDTYAATPLLGGLEPLVGQADSERFRGYLFVGLQVFGVARFLPTDGNTIVDSPSGDRRDWLATPIAGFVLRSGGFSLSYTVNGVFGLFGGDVLGRGGQDHFGTLAVSFRW